MITLLTCFRFEAELCIPQFPEMIYDKNILRIDHASGFSLEFNALNALKLVNSQHGPSFKVDGAAEWLAARWAYSSNALFMFASQQANGSNALFMFALQF